MRRLEEKVDRINEKIAEHDDFFRDVKTPETCAGCHKKQVDQFKVGKHHLGWIAASAMPMWAHQQKRKFHSKT